MNFNYVKKVYSLTGMLGLAGAVCASDHLIQSATQNIITSDVSVQQKSNVDLLKEMFAKGVTNMKAGRSDFEHLYSPDYRQNVDGKTLNYEEFVAHLDDLHKTLNSLKIEFLDIVSEGDKVATRHKAYGVKKNGDVVEVLVVAIFGFKNGKIISCDELTHLIKGAKEDKEIGSRH
jgi:ketosteroid isomerase-like protein